MPGAVKVSVTAAGAGTERVTRLASASVPRLLLPARAATGLLTASAPGEAKAVAMMAATALKGFSKKLSP